ncbi:helix-turn-helix transcriptional regulator [Sporomusa sphaeroides]|uniref:Helix-turn-helix protein n=1 Tax=Sporomusa sphaeroides DSM 2875 TaxID=1337886 RepID=A0ABP2C7S2_9FIRM|nr:helix-turn-helix protein [Sporomusa sphaeroides DSM 2875]CVK18430.1 helix-turn-helix protein [Sporomusa sphaeroides DSM 2875]
MLKNKLKTWRHKYEMNQIEFASFLGVNQSHYNRWENQKLQPTLEMALRISEKLKCTVNDLFYITSEEE